MSLRVQTVAAEYQKLQNDLQNAVEARQRLDSQLSENEMVKKVRKGDDLQLPRYLRMRRPQEFAQLTPNNTVYKLIGPVLVQQEQAEAKTNVDTRLDFIRGEMCIRLLLTFLHTLTFAIEKDSKGS